MIYKVQLQGLHCEACKKISEKRLSKIEGVNEVNVDHKEQIALINSFNALDLVQIQNSLKDTEYKVTSLTEI